MKIVNTIYDATIRRFLPEKIGMRNGVAVRDRKLFDRLDTLPEYKTGTVEAVLNTVSSGDTVVEIGSGYGVCTVHAARVVRPNGEVYSYEAAEEHVKQTRETVELNSVSDYVSVNHAVVGPAVDIWGDSSSADNIKMDELPKCDVLITDCEGGEATLMTHLDATTATKLVVETHGMHGAPTDTIVDEIKSHGYTIDNIKDAGSIGSPDADNDVVIAVMD